MINKSKKEVYMGRGFPAIQLSMPPDEAALDAVREDDGGMDVPDILGQQLLVHLPPRAGYVRTYRSGGTA